MSESMQGLETKVKFPVALEIKKGSIIFNKESAEALLNSETINFFFDNHPQGFQVYGFGSHSFTGNEPFFFNLAQVEALYDEAAPITDSEFQVLPAYVELTLAQYNQLPLIENKRIITQTIYKKQNLRIGLASFKYDEKFWRPKNPNPGYQSANQSSAPIPANTINTHIATSTNIAGIAASTNTMSSASTISQPEISSKHDRLTDIFYLSHTRKISEQDAAKILIKVIREYLQKNKFWELVNAQNGYTPPSNRKSFKLNDSQGNFFYLIEPVNKPISSTGRGAKRAAQALEFALQINQDMALNSQTIAWNSNNTSITAEKNKHTALYLYILLFITTSTFLKIRCMSEVANHYDLNQEASISNAPLDFIADWLTKKTPTKIPDKKAIQQMLAEFLGIDVQSSDHKKTLEDADQKIMEASDISGVRKALQEAFKNLNSSPVMHKTFQ